MIFPQDFVNKIIHGDCLKVMREIPDNTVNCVVTSPPYWGLDLLQHGGIIITMKKRDEKGRFIKNIHYSRKTEFKKGEHWRKPKPYWNKDWLEDEYKNKNKSANQIAREQNCIENNILYFLAKHKIPRRTMKQIRASKHWGLKGKQNGMCGKIGKLNPNWQGGHSPERQSEYAKSVWKELAKSILKRDNYICQGCGAKHEKENRLVVHHIKQWAKYPKLRFEPNNLITLCERCHKNVHKKH